MHSKQERTNQTCVEHAKRHNFLFIRSFSFDSLDWHTKQGCFLTNVFHSHSRKHTKEKESGEDHTMCIILAITNIRSHSQSIYLFLFFGLAHNIQPQNHCSPLISSNPLIMQHLLYTFIWYNVLNKQTAIRPK